MENSRGRLSLSEAGQISRPDTAHPSRWRRLRRFWRAVWAINTSRHALTDDCLRCGYPVVDGMYCFHCGYVRPRTTNRRRGEGAFAEWFFKAR
jgi:hypothetical protein